MSENRCEGISFVMLRQVTVQLDARLSAKAIAPSLASLAEKIVVATASG
jgi:hypothetical protein